jgi:predicted RNase H-like HicB family nuclease
MSDYIVIYETGEDGAVSAYVPDLPMILVTGRDQTEAREAILKGIKLYREEMELAGILMPPPSMRHEVVSV